MKRALSSWITHFRPEPSDADNASYAFLNSRGGRIFVSDVHKNLSSAVARFGGPEMHRSVTFSTTALRSLNDTVVSAAFGESPALQQFRRSDMHSSEVADRHYNQQSAAEFSHHGFAILATATALHNTQVTSSSRPSPSSSSTSSQRPQVLMTFAAAISSLDQLFPTLPSNQPPTPTSSSCSTVEDNSSDENEPLYTIVTRKRPAKSTVSENGSSKKPRLLVTPPASPSSATSSSSRSRSGSDLDNLLDIIDRLRSDDDDD